MNLIPFDKKALIVLALAAIVPLVPLIGTSLPFAEIISKLAEFMV